MTRHSSKSNKLRNVNTVRGRMGNARPNKACDVLAAFSFLLIYICQCLMFNYFYFQCAMLLLLFNL